MLDLNQSRNELTVLQRDVESAQRSLETVNQRYSQVNLEGQANQTDVVVLNQAIAPLYPSGPRVKLNVLLSMFIGGLLGVGFSLLVEAIDRRVRSPEDIIDTFEIPVFAVISDKPENQPFYFRFRELLKYTKTIIPLAWLKRMQPSV